MSERFYQREFQLVRQERDEALRKLEAAERERDELEQTKWRLLNERITATQERDQARAELAEVRAERDRLREEYRSMELDRDHHERALSDAIVDAALARGREYPPESVGGLYVSELQESRAQAASYREALEAAHSTARRCSCSSCRQRIVEIANRALAHDKGGESDRG